MNSKKVKIFVVSIVLLISFVLLNSSVVYATGSSTVSLSSANSSLSSTEKTTFNAKFEAYKGERSGSEVKALINLITENNTKTPEHQIKTGISTSEIDATAKYQVAFKYDSQGYVNEVTITKSTGNSSLSSTPTGSSSLGNTSTNSALKNSSMSKDSQLPKTGTTNLVAILLVSAVILAMVLKIKTNKYKDIK